MKTTWPMSPQIMALQKFQSRPTGLDPQASRYLLKGEKPA